MNHFAVHLKPVQHCELTLLQLKYSEKFFLSRPGYDYKIMSDWLLLFLYKPENLLKILSTLERALKLLPENCLLDQTANRMRQSVTLWSHSMKLWLTLILCYGEGSGTPLQYSCLENPMDGGAW